MAGKAEGVGGLPKGLKFRSAAGKDEETILAASPLHHLLDDLKQRPEPLPLHDGAQEQDQIGPPFLEFRMGRAGS